MTSAKLPVSKLPIVKPCKGLSLATIYHDGDHHDGLCTSKNLLNLTYKTLWNLARTFQLWSQELQTQWSCKTLLNIAKPCETAFAKPCETLEFLSSPEIHQNQHKKHFDSQTKSELQEWHMWQHFFQKLASSCPCQQQLQQTWKHPQQCLCSICGSALPQKLCHGFYSQNL